MKKLKNNINFMKAPTGKPRGKPINFMSMKPMPRPLKNTKYNNAPLKGLNIVNVRSKNIYNISPNAPPRKGRQLVPVPTMIKKESTKQSSPLSKWGDADMDGTVNFLDCSPRNVGDDGFFGDLLSKLKDKLVGPPKYQKAIEAKYERIAEEVIPHPDEKAAREEERADKIESRKRNTSLTERLLDIIPQRNKKLNLKHMQKEELTLKNKWIENRKKAC